LSVVLTLWCFAMARKNLKAKSKSLVGRRMSGRVGSSKRKRSSRKASARASRDFAYYSRVRSDPRPIDLDASFSARIDYYRDVTLSATGISTFKLYASDVANAILLELGSVVPPVPASPNFAAVLHAYEVHSPTGDYTLDVSDAVTGGASSQGLLVEDSSLSEKPAGLKIAFPDYLRPRFNSVPSTSLTIASITIRQNSSALQPAPTVTTKATIRMIFIVHINLNNTRVLTAAGPDAWAYQKNYATVGSRSRPNPPSSVTSDFDLDRRMHLDTECPPGENSERGSHYGSHPGFPSRR